MKKLKMRCSKLSAMLKEILKKTDNAVCTEYYVKCTTFHKKTGNFNLHEKVFVDPWRC